MFFKGKNNDDKPQPICEFLGNPTIEIQTRSGGLITVKGVNGAYKSKGFIIFTAKPGGACVAEFEFVSFRVVIANA